MPARVKESIMQRIALACEGDPQHIADTALFLLTNHYITGQIITVDGGRSLYI